MLAILFVLSITIGPLIAAACALIAAEKGNYAKAAMCQHRLYGRIHAVVPVAAARA